MKDNSALTLRVAEARSRDVGRAITRIDPKDMVKIGAEVGDIVKIKGKRETVAKIMPTYMEDRGKGVIQMDGLIRENAQIGLGERISLQKSSHKPAERITLSPLTLMRGMR
ncbi:MAG: AAA family ATPase, partial [bacterium]